MAEKNMVWVFVQCNPDPEDFEINEVIIKQGRTCYSLDQIQLVESMEIVQSRCVENIIVN